MVSVVLCLWLIAIRISNCYCLGHWSDSPYGFLSLLQLRFYKWPWPCPIFYRRPCQRCMMSFYCGCDGMNKQIWSRNFIFMQFLLYTRIKYITFTTSNTHHTSKRPSPPYQFPISNPHPFSASALSSPGVAEDSLDPKQNKSEPEHVKYFRSIGSESSSSVCLLWLSLHRVILSGPKQNMMLSFFVSIVALWLIVSRVEIWFIFYLVGKSRRCSCNVDVDVVMNNPSFSRTRAVVTDADGM